MTKIPALKKIRFWSLLLLGTLAIALAGVNEARAAFAVGTAACTANNKTTTGTTGTALPCTVATQAISAGEIAVLWFAGDNTATANGNDGLLASVADSAGNAWTVQRCYTYGTPGAGAGATTCVATSKITTTIPIAGTITATFASITAKAIVVKNFTVGAGNTIAVSGTPQDIFNGGTSTAPGSLTISGLAASTEYLFVRATALERPNTPLTWTVTASHTTSGCTGTTGGNALTNMETCGEFRILTATSDTSNPTATSVDSASTFIAFKEVASTTLGNGTDPGGASLAPGGTATMADAFTFQTSTGTDTITAVVVGLATGTSTGLGLVEITNDAGTTVYGSVTDPASDTPSITLSTNTLTATTTSTQYKIRITPKSHAAMPVPPGSTYTVTAKINSWTGTNTAAGSDTAGTTITIDNLSPGNVTAASGTAGNTQVVLTWTNPADADFNSTVVLRSTTGAVTDTPVEGTTYTVGNIIGSSTVVSVTSTTTFTDTGLTNGTAYDYKIFTRDSNGNYSATGVVPTGSPYTPAGPGCYSVATGNWDSSLTWASSAGGAPGTCPGTLLILGVPDSTTPVYINFTTTSHTVTVNVATAAAASVSIGAPGTGTAGLAVAAGTLTVGGSVTVTGGTGTKKASLTFTTGTLKLGGNLTDSGGTVLTWGTGTVEYNGSGAQTVGGYSYYNLTINKSAGTATTGASMTIGNNLTLTIGTLNIGNRTIDGSGALTLASGSTLQIGAGYFPAYATTTINANSTVEYNPTGNMNVPVPGGGANYGNLLLSTSGNRNINSAMTIAGNFTTSGTVVALVNANLTVNGNLSIGTGTGFTSNPALSHIVKGNFTNNGTFTPDTSTFTFNGTAAQTIGGSATSFYNFVAANSAGVTTSVDLSIAGNFTNTAGFGAGSTTTTFNGTTAQTLGGSATTFYGLVFNNAAGFTINYDTTASNALTFTSGAVATGTNTLIFSSTSTCTATRTSGYVNGKLKKNFTASVTTCNFEVGDSTNYTPVNVALTSVTAGSVTASIPTPVGDHPDINNSGIDGTNSVNRYWKLTPEGSLAFTGSTLTFTYIGGSTVDNDNTAVVGDYITQRYDSASASWITTTKSGTSTTTSAAATGISTFGTPGTSYSEFAIGKPTATADSGAREREFIFNRELFY